MLTRDELFEQRVQTALMIAVVVYLYRGAFPFSGVTVALLCVALAWAQTKWERAAK